MDPMALLSGISQSVSLYQTAVRTLDDAKIASATNELNAQLIRLGAEVLAMQKDGLEATERERAYLTRVHNLEGEVRKLEERQADRSRYELHAPYPGTVVLRVKEAARGTEPEHYVCPGCLDNHAVKSILQFNNRAQTVASCPACKTNYRFGDLGVSDEALQKAGAPPGPHGWMAR
ncbi:hypothetical protein [uncultured Achromobacter sp.]|nr:hypothetical protein [uncultured Achromobacter sp.]